MGVMCNGYVVVFINVRDLYNINKNVVLWGELVVNWLKYDLVEMKFVV